MNKLTVAFLTVLSILGLGLFFAINNTYSEEVVPGAKTKEIIEEVDNSKKDVLEVIDENEKYGITGKTIVKNEVYDNITIVTTAFYDFMLKTEEKPEKDVTPELTLEKLEQHYNIGIIFDYNNITLEDKLLLYDAIYNAKNPKFDHKYDSFIIDKSEIMLKKEDNKAIVPGEAIKVSGTNAAGKKVVNKHIPDLADITLILTDDGWKIDHNNIIHHYLKEENRYYSIW